MHGARIRTIAAFIGAAVVASLAGCGGTASSPTPSAHWVVTSAAIPGPSIGETVDATTLDREVSQAMLDAGSCEITITGDGVQLDGQIRLDSGGMDVSLDVQLSGKTVALRVLAGAMYADMHELAPGTKWVKVSPDGTDSLTQQVRSVLHWLWELSDPLALGGLPEGMAPKTLTVVGNASVDGVVTTRYAAETVLTRDQVATLLSAVPPDQRVAVDAFVGTTIRFEEFIDADLLPHRVFVELTRPDGAQFANTVEYTNWGTPVTVTAPPASEVTDLSTPTK